MSDTNNPWYDLYRERRRTTNKAKKTYLDRVKKGLVIFSFAEMAKAIDRSVSELDDAFDDFMEEVNKNKMVETFYQPETPQAKAQQESFYADKTIKEAAK